MKNSNTLFISRFSHKNKNSRPDTYTIFDAYRYGLHENLPNLISLDYYDLYFENGKNDFEATLEKIIKKNQIKFFFISFGAEDFTIDLQFLYNLKLKYKLCIIQTTQDPETFFESRDRYYNQIADYILPFTVIPNNVIYKNYNLKAITLYSLYNKTMFTDLNLEKTIDVSFIGNVNKTNRHEYINYLKKNGINIQTYGVGSDNGFVNHKKMIKIINSSKINLNFTDSAYSDTFDFNTNTNFTIGTHINARIQQAKGRLIEIYLTNSFCLSQDGIGTRALFDDDRICFNSKEDLLKKIQYYLSHPQESLNITKVLHNQALKFDAKDRFKKIIPQLHYNSNRVEKLYIDKNFLKNYTSYHFLFFFNFLFKGKFSFLIQEIKIFSNYKLFDFKTIYYHLKMQSIYAYKRYKRINK
ncbi:glycosyltransferase [Sulfurimonas sp. SWIR-19]|uniref:glycosyltransferase family protein n=1 Tax=Sulfurimonas sp. SWIR-19 TaxID=2878390 RepID=UPI001CF18B6C|nr:glycosyltransferase [Sulfurimonas sp. SWIR-19]UCN00487.1 glycosyltransferase [Sulfurimonas sp. SWIR-19]